MRLCALILLGCLLVSFGVRALDPDTHFLDMCTSETDHQLFADSACYIDPKFGDPGPRVGHPAGYSSPTCDKTKTLTKAAKQILIDAHQVAPSYMRKKLCQLTFHDCGPGANCYQLFVTTSPMSWGFWEAKDLCGSGACTTPSDRKQPIGSGAFIAIAENLLNGETSSIVDLENQLILNLTQVQGDTPPQLQFFRQPTAMPQYAVLDALAHELGHLLLADTNADAFFANHPRLKVARSPKSNCFDINPTSKTGFLSQSWKSAEFKKSGRSERWIKFRIHKGDTLSTNPFDWSVYADVRKKDYPAAAKKISDLYKTKEFVSLWAALRPEEDFVETFKYKVLSDVMPQLMVNFGTADIDVLDYIRSPSAPVSSKLKCLQNDFLLFN